MLDYGTAPLRLVQPLAHCSLSQWMAPSFYILSVRTTRGSGSAAPPTEWLLFPSEQWSLCSVSLEASGSALPHATLRPFLC